MESIERMRDELQICETCGSRPTIAAMSAYADEIERELAERYIELPLDADGVPIRIGDVMEFSKFEVDHPVTRTVDGIGAQGVFFAWCGERGYQQHEATRYRHYHKPTLEDVLEKALNEAAMLDRSDGYWPSAADVTSLADALAVKVREVMGE